MASDVTNYKCPQCTGPLHFDAASGGMKCDYCGSTYPVAQIEAMYAQANANAQQQFVNNQAQAAANQAQAAEEALAMGLDPNAAWDQSSMGAWSTDANGMVTYSCPSCGAEIIADASTAATACPYCDSPTVVPGQLGGNELKPDFVIPFKVDKEGAKKCLEKYYEKKLFLPKVFKDQNKVREIKGMYVPFWLFDSKAEGNVLYHATKVRTYTSGEYRVTETQHYNCRRAGWMTLDKIPTDASEKMPDDYMDTIEPFDYKELTPFSVSYLPGFLADKYDVSVEQCSQRADKRAYNTLEETLRRDVVGYSTVTPVHKNLAVQRGKVHYALMPVWMLNTKWGDEKYMFCINGQTGKTAGELPIAWGQFWLTQGVIFIITWIITALIMLR